MVERSKLFGFYNCQQIVNFKGVNVKLFFSKDSTKDN